MQNQNIYVARLDLIRPEGITNASLCYSHYSCLKGYDELTQHLHAHEFTYYNTLQFQRRIKSYLIGRFVAKQAVAALTGEKLSDIEIYHGVFAQPIVMSRKQNIQVSITHCDDFGLAIAFSEAHPIGIDIERVDANKNYVLERQITQSEKSRIQTLPLPFMTGLTFLWTAKEALSKVLKTGLMTPFDIFEISKLEFINSNIFGYYKNFAQYKTISFTINNYVCSIVHPIKTEIRFDVLSFKKQLAALAGI